MIAKHWPPGPPRKVTDPRQRTAEEIRQELFEQIGGLIRFWADPKTAAVPDTIEGRMDGLVFSILNCFDGTSCGIMGSFRIFPSCHDSDPEYCESHGEDWWPTNAHLEGEAEITDTMLHELWARGRK